jgi:hypothetical protein
MGGNLVSRKDGGLPLTEDQMIAVGILDKDGRLISPFAGGLISQYYDFVSVSYPDSITEVYTFKKGGSSGEVIATITVVYTDSSKLKISTVSKT